MNPDLALENILRSQLSFEMPATLYDVFTLVKQACAIAFQQQGDNFGWLNYQAIEQAASHYKLPWQWNGATHIRDFVKQLSDEDVGTERMNTRTPHAFYRLTGFSVSAFINLYTGKETMVNLDISHLQKFGYLSHLRTGHVMVRGVRTIVELTDNGKPKVTNNLGPGMGEYLDGSILELFGDYLEDDAGRFMRNGALTVHGNLPKGGMRCMKRGQAIIEGTSGHIGVGMEGGAITVQGDVRAEQPLHFPGQRQIPLVGFDSTGGTISLFGDYQEAMDTQHPEMQNRGCTIYHRGIVVHPPDLRTR